MHSHRLFLFGSQAGEELADEIFYTDQGGGRDHEYISLGCDHEAVLAGRTPIQCYVDYVSQFKQECKKNNLWGARASLLSIVCEAISILGAQSRTICDVLIFGR